MLKPHPRGCVIMTISLLQEVANKAATTTGPRSQSNRSVGPGITAMPTGGAAINPDASKVLEATPGPVGERQHRPAAANARMAAAQAPCGSSCKVGGICSSSPTLILILPARAQPSLRSYASRGFAGHPFAVQEPALHSRHGPQQPAQRPGFSGRWVARRCAGCGTYAVSCSS